MELKRCYDRVLIFFSRHDFLFYPFISFISAIVFIDSI